MCSVRVCVCVCVTYNACYPALRLLRACLTYYTYYISCCSRSASQNGSSFSPRLLLRLLLWLAALQTSQAAAIWTCVIIVRVGNWQLLLRSLLPLAGSAANLTSSCENWRCCTAASLTLLGHAWNFSVSIDSLSMHLLIIQLYFRKLAFKICSLLANKSIKCILYGNS